MRITRGLMMTAAAVLVTALAWAGVQAQQAMQAKPTAVAVVDLQAVFNGLEAQEAVQADLRARQEQLQAMLDEKKKRIATLQGDLDLLARDSEAYRQKAAERDQAVIELQVWSEYQSRKLRAEEQTQLQNLFRKTNEAVQAVAQDNGFEVVLYEQQVVNMRGDNNNAQWTVNIVAYAAEANDLTAQIIQRMNNQYQAGE